MQGTRVFNNSSPLSDLHECVLVEAPDPWGLSFASSSIDRFMCSRQYYMYYLALMMGEIAKAGQIALLTEPSQLQTIEVTKFDTDNKQLTKAVFDLIRHATWLKFTQNADLKEQLRELQCYHFAFQSPDPILGSGLDAQNQHTCKIYQWPGRNCLGYALRAVCDVLHPIAM